MMIRPGYNCTGVTNPYLARFNNIPNSGQTNNPVDTAITATQSTATWNSTSPNASINWGKYSGNYILTITAINQCGETFLSSKFVTVGTPTSNPCNGAFNKTTNYRMVVSPNPIKTTEATINLTQSQTPCNRSDMKPNINYKEIYGDNYAVKMYDMNGVEKYTGEFQLTERDDEFSFKVTDINFADNYYILEIRYPDGYLERRTIILDKE